jgi:hypothetical protein
MSRKVELFSIFIDILEESRKLREKRVGIFGPLQSLELNEPPW